MEVDYLIVGAGLTGIILAERLCRNHKARVVLIDRHDYIGGVCFDETTSNQIPWPRFGLQYFSTDSDKVKNYLSQFTEWKFTDYDFANYVSGRLWPLPVSKSTYEMHINSECTEKEYQSYLSDNIFLTENPETVRDKIAGTIGTELYEKFFKNMFTKIYNTPPEDLNFEVMDDKKISGTFKALPKGGYSRMFKKMLHDCLPTLAILFNTDYSEIQGGVKYKHLIYTGGIDSYFNFSRGMLPYKSAQYKHEKYETKFFQSYTQINYPDTEPFTRIIEPKHIFGGKKYKTFILKEFIEKYERGVNEPLFPIITDESLNLYSAYRSLPIDDNVSLIGRTTSFNNPSVSDQVESALNEYERLKVKYHS